MTNLMSGPEIADVLKVKPRTIKEWVRKGFIPHFKIKRNVRFSKEAVMRWVEGKEVKEIKRR